MSDRFHADLSGAGVGSEIELESSQSHHLLKVMRLEPGASVVIFGEGTQYSATYLRALGKNAILKLQRVLEPQRLASVAMGFIVPWIKGGKTEFVVQKLTELGADSITVFQARREVARGGEAKVDRLQKVALEACKQCGRSGAPAINEALSLREAISDYGAFKSNALILYEQEKNLALSSALKAILQAPVAEGMRTSLCFASGPEGGFAPEEIQSVAHAATLVTLGPRILRAETAPLAAAAACLALAGDI